MFLGKASEMLDEKMKSYESYKKATENKPLDILAWKGLLLLHRDSEEYMKYLDAFEGIVKAYEEADDIQSAGDAFRNAIKFINSKGDEESRIRFLEMQLPSSPLYEFMEGRFPKVALTLQRLIKLISTKETSIINKTISKNKFKISSGKATNDTIYRIYNESKLPEYYQQLINVTHDDEERRTMESKLLKYLFSLLKVSPNVEKEPLRKQIQEMASGMIVVKSPEPLAWELEIEWWDVKNLQDLDFDVITYYMENFPTQGLAKTLQGFLHSEISPFATNNNKDKRQQLKPDDSDEGIIDEEEEAVQNRAWTHADVLEVISDGFESDKDSILNYRILGALYLRTQEYESAADIAKSGLEAIKRVQQATLKDYFHAKNHLSVILGSAYIYYQAPKNFDAAISVFDFVLKRNPQSVPAIIGKGLIYVQKGKLDDAEELLTTVHDRYPSDFQALFELSWCKILKSNHEEGREGLKKCLQNVTGSDPQSFDYRAQIWWRIGTSYWNCREQNFEQYTSEAFNAFVTALNENPTYAPAYTSLGLFYADAAGDISRATKCFYKAFELDSGEIDAGQRLAKEFADNSEWSLVEVVAIRVIESERLRTFANQEASWPHKALGIVGLNQRDYAKAVQHFQAAIRLAPKDANSWVGLGETYTNSGRYVAASKAFNRARLLEPTNWIAEFQLGIVQKEIKRYEEAIDAFKQVLEERPREIGVKSTLIETYLLSAAHHLVSEFYSLACDDAINCIKASLEAVRADHSTQDLWRAVGGSCEIFLAVQSQIEDRVPFEDLITLLSTGYEMSGEEVDEQDLEYVKGDEVENLVRYCILSFKLSNALSRADNSSKALGWYNLGLAQLKAYSLWDGQKDELLKESVESFKKAIQLEPKNSRIWNAYGIASAPLNPKVSQHCFIRSLSFNFKDPSTWANLATLYLCSGDLELASETLERTRSIDPDYVPAWVGQGIIESANGKIEEANNLFEHSYLVSKGSDKTAKLLYGMSVFERTHSEKSLMKGYDEELDSGILALEKFLMLTPKSDIALSIEGFLLERDGNYEYGIEFLNKHCQILEQQYEKDEKQEDLIRFARAKTNLARLCLGAREFDLVIEHAEFAIGVIAEVEGDALHKTLLAATLTAGLGYYFAGNFDQSIEYFRQALEQSEEDQDVIVLLAQVLWAHGGDEEKQVALDQLYTSVGNKGTSLKITLLLGVIGIVDDPDLLEAAEDELDSLPLSVLEKDRQNHVQEVLSLIKKSRGPWQRAAFLWPSNYSIWKHVDRKVALRLAVSGNHGVSIDELSNAYTAEKTIEASQRAIFFAPWNINAWQSLRDTIKCA